MCRDYVGRVVPVARTVRSRPRAIGSRIMSFRERWTAKRHSSCGAPFGVITGGGVLGIPSITELLCRIFFSALEIILVARRAFTLSVSCFKFLSDILLKRSALTFRP